MLPQDFLDSIAFWQTDSFDQLILIKRESGSVDDEEGGVTETAPTYEAVWGRMTLTETTAGSEQKQSQRVVAVTRWTVAFERSVTMKATDSIIVNADVTLDDNDAYVSHTGGVNLQIDNVVDLNSKHTFTEAVCIQR